VKLIILDRDGVINVERADYVKSADECVPIDGSIDAIARLHKAGFTVVVATNQSGLARGKFDLDDLEAMHEKLTGLIEEQGAELGAIFYCPHAPEDNCKCRKPLPGLVDAIEAEFNISAEGFYFVGDSLRDLQAAVTKGCKPMLVKTGNGEKNIDEWLKFFEKISSTTLRTGNYILMNWRHCRSVVVVVVVVVWS
jgi:D-glycero-D-manno-heptose 1,7-bisphosphate phosphatase